MAVLLVVGPPPAGKHPPFHAEMDYMFRVENVLEELKIAPSCEWKWSPAVKEYVAWAKDQVTRVVT